MFELEPAGDDAWLGHGPTYPWGGLYGGQIVAQALRAATHTVDDDRRPHSLRAYFIRAGDQDDAVRYDVDRLRDGRSFSTRRVVASQADGVILNLEASYTSGGDEAGLQGKAMPKVPGPDELEPAPWADRFDRRYVPVENGSGELALWLRWTDELGDDPTINESAFAYLSDDPPSEAIKALLVPPGRPLDEFDETQFLVSLDHTIWFHEPMRADQWLLHHTRCDRFVAGHGLTIGEVYSEDGRHVASVAQEMLVRRLRG